MPDITQLLGLAATVGAVSVAFFAGMFLVARWIDGLGKIDESSFHGLLGR